MKSGLSRTRGRQPSWPSLVVCVLLLVGPSRASPATDSAARSFASAIAAESALSARAGDENRRAVAERFERIADRFPADPRAREALLRAARVLVTPGTRSSVAATRAAVALQERFARDYPDDSRAPEALLAAAALERDRLADPRAARATLSDLIVRFPASTFAQEALDQLARSGTAPVSEARPAPDRPSPAPSGAPAAPSPRILRIRSFAGVGGAQFVLELDREASAWGEWDPTDVAQQGGHVFRVTVPGARPDDDLELPDVTGNRWVERVTVLERASGGVRVELAVKESLEHAAFSLGNRVVVTLAPSASTRAVGPVIVDPGHGGKDPGARSAGGLWEKELTLAIGKRCAERLTAAGVSVVLTRSSDVYVPLEERTAIANTNGGSVLVSIHANAAPAGDAQGVETYFLAPARDARSLEAAARENGWFSATADRMGGAPAVIQILDDLAAQFHASESRRLAQVVHGSLVRDLSGLRTIPDLGVKQAPFVVLVGSEMPSVLAEIGFITHPDEGRRLGERAYQDVIANALARGVLAFLGRVEDPAGGST